MYRQCFDWAREHDVGYSHFLSLATDRDVDFGDCHRLPGHRPGTGRSCSIIESIRNGRKLSPAARQLAQQTHYRIDQVGRAEVSNPTSMQRTLAGME